MVSMLATDFRAELLDNQICFQLTIGSQRIVMHGARIEQEHGYINSFVNSNFPNKNYEQSCFL